MRRTDTPGADHGSVATTDAGGNPVALDAIAWDADEAVLSGGNRDGGLCNIWSADLTTGIATFRFSFSAPNCGVTFFDGITVDRVTDTLYVSPDPANDGEVYFTFASWRNR